MEAPNSQSVGPARRRNDKGRRCWSQREEEVLMLGLKELIAIGWKSDNSFRVGYLQKLQGFMTKEFPGTDLKATPHINSKIHGWKKLYGSLFSMLSKSGIGFNNTTKMIDATDEAWDAYVKVDAAAKFMRFKSWPFYEDWCEVFGKDRATGSEAAGFIDAVNEVLNECQGNENDVFDGYEFFFEDVEETADNIPKPIDEPPNSASSKKSSGKKRKVVDSLDPICEILGKYCETTSARLGEIATRIGYEHDMSAARKKVWAAVENIDGMTIKDKLLTSKLLVKNTEDMELFFSLPANAREEFAKMKLSGIL